MAGGPVPMHMASSNVPSQPQYHQQAQMYQPQPQQGYQQIAYQQQYQPQPQQPPSSGYSYQQQLQQQPLHQSRRTPSVNTFSSSSSTVMAPPAAYRTSPTQSDLRRMASTAGDHAHPSDNTAGGAQGGGVVDGSGGSSPQPTSYVALLRRQKATVWCDRAQAEDPRLALANRQAKMRANVEVMGSAGAGYYSSSSLASLAAGGGYGGAAGGASLGGGAAGGPRTSSGLSGPGKVAAKIRHHGKPGVVGYHGGVGSGTGLSETNYVGGVGGVPLRLSATEVEDAADGSGEGEGAIGGAMGGGRAGSMGRHHSRTGSSGRSSTTSLSRRGTGEWQYRSSGSLVGRGSGSGAAGNGNGNGNGNSGGSGNKWSPGPGTPERAGSLGAVDEQRPVAQPPPPTINEPFPNLPVESALMGGGGRTRSNGSGTTSSSVAAERGDSIADLGSSAAAAAAAKSLKPVAANKQSVEDLKRRGSVDERTMTLTTGRLFIANPD